MKRSLYSLFFGVVFVLTFSRLGFAQDINDVGESIVDSTAALPGLIASLSYLGGLVVGVVAIFKIIDHVNNPTQTPLSVPVIRILLSGALFGLPIFTEAVWVTINGPGAAVGFDPQSDSQASLVTWLSTLGGLLSVITSVNTNFNSLMLSIMNSIDEMPALISAVAYLLGLVILVSALYKTRDHVENPSQVPLKDAVIRYLTAGALFALPAVFRAMYETISGSGMGLWGLVSGALSGFDLLRSTETTDPTECLAAFIGVSTTLGGVICNSMVNSISFPIFLNAIAYLIGLVMGVWGIFKIRDHVLEPSKTPVHEGVMRLIAGGCFFSFPYIISVLRETFLSPGLVAASVLQTNNDFNNASLTCGTTNSLDQAMGCFMQDILGPSHVVLNFFSYVAGAIFIMIGISRLIKSAQEGARGPGGIGTFGTFVIGGMLISATTILRAFSSSLFDSTVTYTFASLQYTGGMSPLETQAAHNVISAVLQFLIVLGLISFVRGLFIMRDVAEGKGNASTMAGVTHLIGGALAVNMGPLLNAIQQTLGITAFGVGFS